MDSNRCHEILVGDVESTIIDQEGGQVLGQLMPRGNGDRRRSSTTQGDECSLKHSSCGPSRCQDGMGSTQHDQNPGDQKTAFLAPAYSWQDSGPLGSTNPTTSCLLDGASDLETQPNFCKHAALYNPQHAHRHCRSDPRESKSGGTTFLNTITYITLRPPRSSEKSSSSPAPSSRRESSREGTASLTTSPSPRHPDRLCCD